MFSKFSKFIEKHFAWCIEGIENPEFTKTDLFREKKRQFKKRGLIIMLIAIILFYLLIIEKIIPFLLSGEYPYLATLLALCFIFSAGVVEFIAGLCGFPPVSP